MQEASTPAERLHQVLKTRDKGVYPEGPNPDVPWISIVAKYLADASHWLDVGCRTGFYIGEAVRMARKCPQLSIIEPDLQMFSFVQEYLKNLNICTASIATDQWSGNTEAVFDLVTCRDEKPDTGCIYKCLKPGGTYIQFFPVRNLDWNDRLDFIMSRDSWLQELATDLGFEPVEAKGWGSKWSTNLDTLVDYLEIVEGQSVSVEDRKILLQRYGVGAGVCVEEFGAYAVLRKP